MTRRIFLVLAAALALAGCATAPSTESVRVATYNIRLSKGDVGTANAWSNRCDAVIGLIRKMDLDAFGLQEVRPDQAVFFRERLPEYAFVGDHRAADRVSDEASPVFYRKSRFDAVKAGTFWLSETPDTPGLKGWDAACPRVCSYLILREKASGKTFCFANTHTDHRGAVAREKGMLLVIERMKEFGKGAPIVFVGDHNCRETEAPALAVSKVLRNAFYRSETPPRGSWRSFNGWRWRANEVPATEALGLSLEARNEPRPHPDVSGATRGKSAILDDSFYEKCGGPRIDYIYVSEGIRVLDYETHADARPGTELYPSDHFPISATIAL